MVKNTTVIKRITDFRVVCDESNNTAAVIDRNEFIASIFIKSAYDITISNIKFEQEQLLRDLGKKND
jgi:hypothetical protein